MRIKDDGNIVFNDSLDEQKYISFLKNLKEYFLRNKKEPVFTMSFDLFEDKITSKQTELWNVLMRLTANESGNDYDIVKETVLKRFTDKTIEEMTKQEFSSLILSATSFIQDFFDVNIQYNENTERFDVKKGL